MSTDRSGINTLLDMQKQLMEEVPHELRGTAVLRMFAGHSMIEVLLKYLNSTGHKPWRPIPLTDEVQRGYLEELKARVFAMEEIHENKVLDQKNFAGDTKHFFRQLVSAYGTIEEAIEYLNSLQTGTKAEQLEELTDGLFFYLEQVLLSGFAWEEIETEYKRKWDVNMDRYRRAKEGDYSWDKREEGKL